MAALCDHDLQFNQKHVYVFFYFRAEAKIGKLFLLTVKKVLKFITSAKKCTDSIFKHAYTLLLTLNERQMV